MVLKPSIGFKVKAGRGVQPQAPAQPVPIVVNIRNISRIAREVAPFGLKIGTSCERLGPTQRLGPRGGFKTASKIGGTMLTLKNRLACRLLGIIRVAVILAVFLGFPGNMTGEPVPLAPAIAENRRVVLLLPLLGHCLDCG